MDELDFNVALEPAPFPVETQLPYRIVSDAIGFMRTTRDQPFFMQVSIPEPHDPEQVPHPYWDMFPPDEIPERCAGREALEKLGYRANWLDRHPRAGFIDTEKVWRCYEYGREQVYNSTTNAHLVSRIMLEKK